MKPLVIELYCGTFGWSCGWLARGGRAIGFDIEHLPHHGEIPGGASLVLQDVRTLVGAQFKDAALILASPPCQEFSYRAMPWTRARALGPPELGMELFAACFRIQREASEAAGRHVPMVVENVRGAQKWVGRAAAHFGSYYLWGDVPVLMPVPFKAHKAPGFRFDGSKKSFQQAAVEGSKGIPHRTAGHWTNPGEHEGRKNDGGLWFNIGSPGQKEVNRNPVHEGRKGPGQMNWKDFHTDPNYKGQCFRDVAGAHAIRQASEGVKGFTPNGEPLGKNVLGRKHGSKSTARKAASALIARIPERLSDWIAEVYFPQAGVRAVEKA